MNLIATWTRFQKYPCGKWLFSRALGKMIPYSGTMGARVQEFQPGYAKITLRDRRVVRNHLQSIHAVALMNLGELCSGLATVGALPSTLRGILVGYRIEYLKKARGTLTAESRCAVSSENTKQEITVPVEIKNSEGDTVCRAYATWLVSPVRS